MTSIQIHGNVPTELHRGGLVPETSVIGLTPRVEGQSGAAATSLAGIGIPRDWRLLHAESIFYEVKAGALPITMETEKSSLFHSLHSAA